MDRLGENTTQIDLQWSYSKMSGRQGTEDWKKKNHWIREEKVMISFFGWVRALSFQILKFFLKSWSDIHAPL